MQFMQFILNHWWLELLLIAIAVLGTYASFTTQTVPELRPIASSPLQPEDQELRELSFKYMGCYDASMTGQVPMHLWTYLSADRLHAATVINVWAAAESFSLVEFSSELSPHGSITTSTSKVANISAYPPDKMVIKVPWKKRVADVFGLHELLCKTATENQFAPVPMDPGRIRDRIIEDTRKDLEYLVARGRMVKVSSDCYRFSLKGAIIAVPRVWHKMLYGFAYGLLHPSDQAQCRRLAVRLRKARSLPQSSWVS